MREHLLRQALESGKTTSKKQRQKNSSATPSLTSSRNASANNSQAGSAATSRTASVEGSSVGSDDEDEITEPGNPIPEEVLQDLSECIEDITLNPKRMRQHSIQLYNNILGTYFVAVEADFDPTPIVEALSVLIASQEEKTASFALKALTLTVLNDPSVNGLEMCAGRLRSIIQSHSDEAIKVRSLKALSILAFYTGFTTDVVDVMGYLLEIIESDGSYVNAENSIDVVVVAITYFSFLASKLRNLDPDAGFFEDVERDMSQDAIEALSDQLESSAVAVQIAAAEGIALLYEKSADPLADDELRKLLVAESNFQRNDSEDKAPGVGSIASLQIYQPYRQTPQLLDQLETIKKQSSRSIAKADRAPLHQTIEDVIQAIESPGTGPGSRVHNQKSWKGRPRNRADKGKRKSDEESPTRGITYRISATGATLTIDSWSMNIQFRLLKETLGQGFFHHIQNNDLVMETLFPQYEGTERNPMEENVADSRRAETKKQVKRSNKTGTQSRNSR